MADSRSDGGSGDDGPRAVQSDPQSVSGGTSGSSGLAGSRLGSPGEVAASRAFFELAPTEGVEWQYANGQETGVSSIVESLGGGVGLADFDRDGRCDIFVTGGGAWPTQTTVKGLSSGLMHNLGDWKFREVGTASRVASVRHYTHGIAAADFDNDGFVDVLVTGYGGIQLFLNCGDGTFADVTDRCAIDDPQWSSSAAWGDLDNDGDLDLYICHYVDWSFDKHPFRPGPASGQREVSFPADFNGLNDSLFLNQGDGTFIDATAAWDLVPGGKGLGVVIGDVNDDGRPDIYVANDTTDNFLYKNLGDRLSECGIGAGVARDEDGVPNGSMGVDLCDINGDLRPDLWATNYERESSALYRNEGNALFLHVSRPMGITALGGLFVGFGTSFSDVDGDGDKDVVIANGHVIKYPMFSARQQKPLLLLREGSRFKRAVFPAGNYFDQGHEGRGLAMGDLDNDGRCDVVISNVNEPLACLRSTLSQDVSQSFTVQLVGTRSNRDAIGARVLVVAPQGTISELLNGGGSYLSTRDSRISIQIPNAWKPEYCEVRWPNGVTARVGWDQIQDGQLTMVERTIIADPNP